MPDQEHDLPHHQNGTSTVPVLRWITLRRIGLSPLRCLWLTRIDLVLPNGGLSRAAFTSSGASVSPGSRLQSWQSRSKRKSRSASNHRRVEWRPFAQPARRHLQSSGFGVDQSWYRRLAADAEAALYMCSMEEPARGVAAVIDDIEPTPCHRTLTKDATLGFDWRDRGRLLCNATRQVVKRQCAPHARRSAS